MEAELKSLTAQLQETLSTAQNSSSAETITKIDGLTAQLLQLREQLQKIYATEDEVLQMTDKRIKHLKDGIKAVTNKESVNEEWKQQRLDRIICDHLLRIGQYDTAEALAKFAGIHDFTNLGIFRTSRVVEASLKQHDCSKALEWCKENSGRLNKLKSTLQFKLHLQEYVELVRHGKRKEAIAYAGLHFKDSADRVSRSKICVNLEGTNR